MRNIKRLLFMLAIALTCGAYSSSAQEIIVRARPPIPHYEHIAAPSPRHVWIDEEWEPRGGSYVFVGGHWALPPHPGMFWVGGRWDRRGERGEVWRRGHWDRRR